ncbi:MAG: pyridoxamine 5'-phosphate oxidase family protein [Clostridia bacterium]|nr:pyridoxamine 5'-phosphate oxidase family protein [Clostridia bacterium]
MKTLKDVEAFLDKAGLYYLATEEGEQPRVRPFGTAMIYEGRLYIQTGKKKDVFRQLQANPKAEICAFYDGVWLRVCGTLVRDETRDAKVAMLDKYPDLKAMYDPDDGNTEVLYFTQAKATFASFTAPAETICF